MNIDKVSSRAKKLAEQLGVEFKAPDYNSSINKANKKIDQLKEYSSRKSEYDAAVQNIMDNYSKDDILAFINSTNSPK